MHADLRTTLDALLRSGSTTNPALEALLDDYARYHTVFVVLGGALTLASLGFGAWAWGRYRRVRRAADGRSPFERRVPLGFAVLGLAVGLGIGLVVAANAGNARDPRPGFAGAVGLIEHAPAGGTDSPRDRAFDAWLRSGQAERPTLVDERIDDRLAWQRPKAVISAVLLVLMVVAGTRLWRGLIGRARWRVGPMPAAERLRLAAAVGSVPAVLVLAAMVIGNTQASLAPLSMTLFYG